MRGPALTLATCTELPDTPDLKTVYRLLPASAPPGFYAERTDRHVGWITQGEQELLRKAVVGVAGCGGMGGLVALTLVRLGIGEVRIADCVTFDVSNLNRQYGARRGTPGESKAFETARMIRDTLDDTTLQVYGTGITEDTVDDFVAGCTLICDEIEVLAIDARILLHERAREKGVSLFNCNTAGFGSCLFLYTPDSMTMEEATGLSYLQAKKLRTRAEAGDGHAITEIGDRMMEAVVPKLPVYSGHPDVSGAAFNARLKDRKVPIIATNPVMAAGFLADRVLFHLLRNSGIARSITETPPMPGYLYIDAGHMRAEVNTNWRPHARPAS